MRKTLTIFILFLALWASRVSQAQIITDPALPVATKPVTITFDSSKETQLGTFTGELYAHTGVIIEGNGEWQHVIGDWANNTNQPKLTNKGGGIYELVISPDINTFYSVPGTEKVVKMAFVFRSANWNSDKKQTKDLFVDVFQEGLVVSISTPADGAIFEKNRVIGICANSSQDATIKIKEDAHVLATVIGGDILCTSHTLTGGGWKWIIAEASSPEKTVLDSVHIYVKEPVVAAVKPAGVLKGINYGAATSATLVLQAPQKNFVFVLGDFNNWQLNDNYQMKKDGDYFWLELNGLTTGQPYTFQYLVDGQIRIADPYTNQTSDPNDQYIPAATYPGLISYPEGKASGVASVLQTGQIPYAWEVPSFTPPAKDRLVIYETLIRDFTAEHTCLSTAAKLDYLKELGINVLELMPVNEFEGNESWGYNPSFYFATDKYYGPKNDLKKLVDEAHKRGMAVVIDMVLNHSYGQSPLVKMYWDATNNQPGADNPWYNTRSNFQNPGAQWGYDFNHESTYTRELVDSINSFWMKEFKVDGFRFDFTKGFSNTVWIGNENWGNAYDAARIANLKRMATEIWKRNEKALVIFEHLSDNSEEKELANHGIMLWGNLHGAYTNAAKGDVADLTWGIFSSRGWDKPNLVTYMESHDEERIVLECKNSGKTEGSYNIKLLPTALDRVELASLFMLPLPGAKMIWQFGELGYDYSINTCTNPAEVKPECRLSPKPILWNYFNNENRKDVYKMMGRLNYLKVNYEEFSSGSSYTGSLNGEVKWYRLSNGNNHVVAVGNFATTTQTVSVSFPVTGTWYDYFSGSTLSFDASSQEIRLDAGAFRLFSTRKFADPFAPNAVSVTQGRNGGLSLFPNPAGEKVRLRSDRPLGRVVVRNMAGQVVLEADFEGVQEAELRLDNLIPGMYLVFSEGSGKANGSLPAKLLVY